MSCYEYDQLTKASANAMEALQSGVHPGSGSFWKNRVRSRLIIAEIEVTRHISNCQLCQELRRVPDEFNSIQLYS